MNMNKLAIMSTTVSLYQECLVCKSVAADAHVFSCIHGDICMAVYKLEHQCGFYRFAEANLASSAASFIRHMKGLQACMKQHNSIDLF